MSNTVKHIATAKGLLENIHHAAMATVNADGTPHNTPFHFQIDEERKYIYWASNPDSVHSQNLARTGQAYIVLYIPGTGDGLYIRAEHAHLLEGDELAEGLRLRNEQRTKVGRPLIDTAHYSGSTKQRMYRAELMQFWVNEATKDAAGNITNDWRTEIAREDLLA